VTTVDPVLAEARTTTHRVARTFGLASRLLPRGLRDDVHRLYLAFRLLDDAVDDGHPDAESRLAAVEAWCDGEGADPSFREASIFAEVATRHPLPPDALRDFCAGMRADLDGPDHVTEADLDVYCHQVAGTVGLTMARVLGAQGPEADRRADALGMAMQRTNVLRDIDEDRAAGRVYLAAQSLDRCGGGLEPGRREALLRDQIARADALYEEGIPGIRLLPHGRLAISAAASMYREILRQIERDGYGERPGRAVVRPARKLAVAARRVAIPR
jgi:phytoene synthase